MLDAKELRLLQRRARAYGQVTLWAGLCSALAHNGIRLSPYLPHAFSEAWASYTGRPNLYHVLLGWC